MILYLDNDKRIIAINSTERTDLTAVEFDESVMDFPFTGWSKERICCYCIDYNTDEEQRNHITMITPYVPTHMMSALESLDTEDKILQSNQIKTEISITDMDLKNIATEQTLTDIDLRLLVLEG